MTPFLLKVYNALDFVGKTEKDIQDRIYPLPLIGQQVGAARHAHIVQALNKLRDRGLVENEPMIVVITRRAFERGNNDTE